MDLVALFNQLAELKGILIILAWTPHDKPCYIFTDSWNIINDSAGHLEN